MKETPLTAKHIALGAKMAEFAGYNMPISYKGIIEEHKAVRNSVGLFDVSHMGEFILKGKDAEKLIQSTTSNDVSLLEPGAARRALQKTHPGSRTRWPGSAGARAKARRTAQPSRKRVR